MSNKVVDVLQNKYLIRAEERAGSKWFELTHDRLINPIKDSNKKHEETIKKKIFVSYSKIDAGDFANWFRSYFTDFNFHIFIDANSIKVGEIWGNTIEQNISNCDIFVVIVTYGDLHTHMSEREVFQAQIHKKKIIPCFHKGVLIAISMGIG